MGKPRTISKEKLQLKDAPTLIWIKVSTALKYLWSENPKLHDIGSVITSIDKHGFQEIPKFDKHIGIKAGNGRVEALAWMEKDGGYDLPRGLAKIKDSGEWVMPLLMGTDAESINLARSYAIDSNNMTMSGGNFTDYDMARLWDKEIYMDLLQTIAGSDGGTEHLPVTVSSEVLDHLVAIMPNDGILPPDDFSEYDDDIDIEHRCPKCGYEWSGKSR